MKKQVKPYDILEQMILSRDKALDLQAKEYERRLLDLNHENQRILQVLDKSIPREVFDRTVEAMNARTQLNTDYINAAKGKGSGASTVVGYIFGAAGFLSTLIAIFYYLSKK